MRVLVNINMFNVLLMKLMQGSRAVRRPQIVHMFIAAVHGTNDVICLKHPTAGAGLLCIVSTWCYLFRQDSQQ